ncbi:flagellar assembly protein FliW [Paenibacillus sp. NFR01]|uniref:flagellar assembly protein FliW n=1 Tax=Paenibacillus sp. NFR01 TaxID=1566279 RepID=UPI0008BEE2A4|nr:flagellar assembly protein FliW [Paenibacillus sp. NFR01]SEU14170.1 flagellar assembly factor FliW [Paenibacillus sp. NFR01]
MLIETSAWGTLEISEDQVYNFPKGIPGFEEETEFALIHFEEGPFSYLCSLKNDALSFLICDPFVFHPEYEFELPQSDIDELKIQDSVIVRSIVTLREPVDQSTLNLLAPVVLNPITKTGKQTVLHTSAYQARHPLWAPDMARIKKEGE